VIARADHFRAQGTRLVDLLHGFLQSPDVGARSQHTAVSEAKSWQLPLAFSAQSRRAYDGAVLVGDAGGLVDAATGEGIHFAVASALFAAAAVEDALGAGRVDAVMLSSYDRQCEAHLGRLIRRSRRFHRWVAGRPEVMEALFIVANASPPALRAVLNWMSTDFVLQP
jgi:flavin-dependent dehydrogenase